MQSSIIPTNGRTWSEVYNEVKGGRTIVSLISADAITGTHAVEVCDIVSKDVFVENLSFEFIAEMANKELKELHSNKPPKKRLHTVGPNTYVIFTQKGVEYTGTVIKNDNGYDIIGIEDLGLRNAMRAWYYYTQVDKKE